MGFFDRFRRKKKETELPELPEEHVPATGQVGLESANAENVKAKIELLMTQMDSLQTQYSALNERIKNIERLVMEIRSFCK